jgi:hypothetical protein
MLGAAPGARKAGRARRHPRDANGAAAYSVGIRHRPGREGKRRRRRAAERASYRLPIPPSEA